MPPVCWKDKTDYIPSNHDAELPTLPIFAADFRFSCVVSVITMTINNFLIYGQGHGRNLPVFFLICQCEHAHSCYLYCAKGLLQGSSIKKKSVSGSSFIRGKSVNEELIPNRSC